MKTRHNPTTPTVFSRRTPVPPCSARIALQVACGGLAVAARREAITSSQTGSWAESPSPGQRLPGGATAIGNFTAIRRPQCSARKAQQLNDLRRTCGYWRETRRRLRPSRPPPCLPAEPWACGLGPEEPYGEAITQSRRPGQRRRCRAAAACDARKDHRPRRASRPAQSAARETKRVLRASARPRTAELRHRGALAAREARRHRRRHGTRWGVAPPRRRHPGAPARLCIARS
jgi:hypothetical protein